MLRRKKRKSPGVKVAAATIDQNAAGFRFGVGLRQKLDQTSTKFGTTLNEKQFAFGSLTRNIILLLILGASFIYFSIDIVKALNLIF